MILQFIKLTLQRNFIRNRFHTLINILGLSIGLSSFILFIIFINKVSNYDTFHKNYDKIYRLVGITDDTRGDFCGTPAQLGPFLKERVPEIEKYVRFEDIKDVVITKDEIKFFETDLLYADNSFFEVFSFPIIEGNKSNPIENIGSVVISKKMADKYFGDKNPIGQILKIGKSGEEYKVSAVVQNYPSNSTIKYSFILSFEIIEKEAQWGMFNYNTYLLLNNKNNKLIAENKIQQSAVDRGGDNIMKLNFIRMQAIKDMRFEQVRGNTFNTIDKKYIYIFLFASFFTLLLAIINYTNLATAISLKRSKEVAIKKILGSKRRQIIIEFLTESILLTLFALIVAFIIVELLSPLFGQLINEEIKLSYSYIPIFILIALVVGIFSGFYPSIYGSRYNPIGILKESAYKGKKAKHFRNFLIIIQFGLTSFLLICAITFSSQLDYMFNRNLGLNIDNVYEIQANWEGIKLNELKKELKNFSFIQNVSTSTFAAGEDGWNQSTWWEGMKENDQINMFILKTDKDFFSTFNIEFLEKLNDFDNLNFNLGDYYIINNSAKKYIGWKESLNKTFTIFSNQQGQIAGVVNDFNFRSLRFESSPTAILLSNEPILDKIHVKIIPGKEDEFYSTMNKVWKDFAPANAPLFITNLKQDFENLYGPEKKTQKVIILFTIIAMIISMLGLLGLATFITLQRTKEIGIRKALGSNNRNVIIMFLKEFIKWVFIAFIISLPLSYLYINNWLNNFSYHIKIRAWIFITAAFIILFIAFISVIVQTYRAARKNPVDSLRYE